MNRQPVTDFINQGPLSTTKSLQPHMFLPNAREKTTGDHLLKQVVSRCFFSCSPRFWQLPARQAVATLAGFLRASEPVQGVPSSGSR